MRRWFAIVLLVFLPVQFTWAAVSDYVAHMVATGHAGHHDHAFHDHAAGAATEGVPSDVGGTPDPSPHLACDHCHGQCVGLIDPVSPVSAQAPGDTKPAVGDAPCVEHAPAQPERPQWARLA